MENPPEHITFVQTSLLATADSISITLGLEQRDVPLLCTNQGPKGGSKTTDLETRPSRLTSMDLTTILQAEPALAQFSSQAPSRIPRCPELEQSADAS